MFKIATFNVNSVNARLPILLEWLKRERIDVVGLQEIKCTDETFPHEAFAEIGYQASVRGQKSYNGVAFLSRHPFEAIERPDVAFCRAGEARLMIVKVRGVWYVNSYIPQGRDVEHEQFAYKLSFLEGLGAYLEKEGYADQDMVWLGDLNVAMDDRDVYDPERLRGRVCFHPEEQTRLREATRRYVDLFRKHIPDDNVFTFWDYRVPNGVKRNIGWRIDHVYATSGLADRSSGAFVARDLRLMERPSDHTALVVSFEGD